MDVWIKSVNFEQSDALNAEIKKKLLRAFSRYDYINSASVFLKIQKNTPEEKRIMEIRLGIPKGELFSETRDTTFRNALDRNLDKLKRQLEKYKEKVYHSSSK